MKLKGVAVNGHHRPEAVTPGLFGEWKSADRWVALLWVPLLLLLSAPWPVPFGIAPSWLVAPLPERAIPIAFLLLAGGGILLGRVARVSWPLAALLAWALARAVWMGFEVQANSLMSGVAIMDQGHARPLQILIGLSLVALLYSAARDISWKATKLVAWGLVAGALLELGVGLYNVIGGWAGLGLKAYPFMGWVQPDQIGRPMGFLTHPNYWGSYMALALPVLWSLLGTPVALVTYGAILVSRSAGPAITASVIVLVAIWPRLGARMKYLTLAGASAACAVVMTLHEWRLNGRWENWTAAWSELIRYPIIGQGIGSWRIFSEHYNAKLGKHYIELQAHNEPYQLWFELGLIGVALAGLFVWQAWKASRTTWENCPVGNASWWQSGWLPLERAWLAVLVGGLVNALGSPVLHLPAQAAIILFALARVQAYAAEQQKPLTDVVAPGRRRRREARKELERAESH